MWAVLLLSVAGTSGGAVVDDMHRQAARTARSFTPGTEYPSATAPPTTGNLSEWKTSSASSWTAGFFPGLLWQLLNLTSSSSSSSNATSLLRESAEAWTDPLAVNRNNTDTHDVGFMVFGSFGKAIELAPAGAPAPSWYRQVVIDTAHSLATRFNPAVGCTQSWNAGHHCRTHPGLLTEFPVIIDNMMNLELLLWVGRETGNATLTEMAISHADVTAANHVRDDGSTFHVVDYNPVSGEVKARCTAQGYRDNSTWSRGQAWCVYGFTMLHRYTQQGRFLKVAEQCADYFISHLPLSTEPSDGVPLWDFDWDGASKGLALRDSSAGAIAASALWELGSVEGVSRGKRAEFKAVAQQLIQVLTQQDYLGGFDETQGIVMHATSSFAVNRSVDVSLIYSGYFLAEALLRQKQSEIKSVVLA